MELLLSGTRTSQTGENYPHALALIQASLEHNSGELDSASPEFAALLAELRCAAGFGAAAPWLNAEECMPWAGGMGDVATLLQDELSAALQQDEPGTPNPQSWEGASYEAIAPTWRVQHLWQHGEWLPEARARFPKSVDALQRLEAMGELELNPMQNVACGIARQPAGSGIAPHCDGNVLGLTCHLGLRVPSQACWIEVGGETRTWREGELLLMDTTFTHRTRNDSPSDRYVLMLNVLRPGVHALEARMMQRHLAAPPLRLERINPFYVWLPRRGAARDVTVSHGQQASLGAPPPSAGDVFVAASPECEHFIEVCPGRMLPVIGDDETRDGLGLVVPLSGQTFEVIAPHLDFHSLPTFGAAEVREVDDGARGGLAAGAVLAPELGFVDSDGYLTWLGCWKAGTAAALTADEASEPSLTTSSTADARTTAAPLDVPIATLRQHTALLRAPLYESAVWLPMLADSGEPWVRELSPEEAAAAPTATRGGTGAVAGGDGQADDDVASGSNSESHAPSTAGRGMGHKAPAPARRSGKGRKKGKRRARSPLAEEGGGGRDG